MIQVAEHYPAPLHDDKLNVIAVADAAQAAYVNYLTLVRMGVLPEQDDYSAAGAKAITEIACGLKAADVLRKVAALPHLDRIDLIRLAERDFRQQTGQAITMDPANPCAPLLIWGDCSAYIVTSDGKMPLGVRSNSSNETAKLVPPSYGWAQVEDGVPLGLGASAALHLERKFGITGEVVQDVGIIRQTNALEAYAYQTLYGGCIVPGVIPLFSYVGLVETRKTFEQLRRDITLNDQNFGFVAYDPRSFDDLADGRLARSLFWGSLADATGKLVVKSLGGRTPASGRALITDLADFRTFAEAPDAQKIAARNPLRDDGRYPTAPMPLVLEATRYDAAGVGRCYWAEAGVAAAMALLPVASADACRAAAFIEPMPHTGNARISEPRRPSGFRQKPV